MRNNGKITTPDKIKLNQKGGAPTGPSPNSCGEFSDGVIKVPGIKFVDLYSGTYGLTPNWKKIGTTNTNLQTIRSNESEALEIKNNTKY